MYLKNTEERENKKTVKVNIMIILVKFEWI